MRWERITFFCGARLIPVALDGAYFRMCGFAQPRGWIETEDPPASHWSETAVAQILASGYHLMVTILPAWAGADCPASVTGGLASRLGRSTKEPFRNHNEESSRSSGFGRYRSLDN